jgi:hypothetical protein
MAFETGGGPGLPVGGCLGLTGSETNGPLIDTMDNLVDRHIIGIL